MQIITHRFGIRNSESHIEWFQRGLLAFEVMLQKHRRVQNIFPLSAENDNALQIKVNLSRGIPKYFHNYLSNYVYDNIYNVKQKLLIIKKCNRRCTLKTALIHFENLIFNARSWKAALTCISFVSILIFPVIPLNETILKTNPKIC